MGLCLKTVSYLKALKLSEISYAADMWTETGSLSVS
jgi:hypothetical protein